MYLFFNPTRTKVKTPLKSRREQKPSFISTTLKNEKFQQVSGLLLILVSLFLSFSFTSYLFTWKADQSIVSDPEFGLLLSTDTELTENKLGVLGALVSHFLINNWLGISAYLFAFWSFLLGWRVIFKSYLLPWKKTLKYSAFLLCWCSITFGYFFHDSLSYLGGSFGFFISKWMSAIVGDIGVLLFITFALASFLVTEFNFKKIGLLINSLIKKGKQEDIQPVTESANSFSQENGKPEIIELPTNSSDISNQGIPVLDVEPKPEESEENKTIEFDTPVQPEDIIKPKPKSSEEISLAIEETTKEVEAKAETVASDNDSLYDPTLELSNYKHPTLDLLEDYGNQRIEVAKEELEMNKDKIIETLGHYKIGIDQIKATIGPTVTLYEIVPTAGVKISRIKNLEDDIALSLSALGIRIIAPIPGKGTIGIEVPNSKPEIVSMKSLLGTEKFEQTDMELPIALGKTISNEVYIVDLVKMPHILMAGATGQGKSVGINVILNSLLYKRHPSQLKFVMVDPKKVELSLYSKIEKYFLAKLPDAEDPIITDTKSVVRTLNSLVIEMESRYELLKNAKVRIVKEYNIKFVNRKLNPNEGHRFLPYIILVIDEFADLIMTAGKEAELPLTRLAQLARAIGIHLIIATQRPSVNIITGTIKANFPARIAFKVTSKIDSRTILDTGGADQLVGRGDMLFSQGSDVVRLQCGFIDTHEVERIVDFIADQKSYPETFLLPEYIEESGSGGKGVDVDEYDQLFDDAARVVVQNQQGSTSLIQRRLKLGYNRAGRIIDQLEAVGIVGPFEGSKARAVLIPDELALEQFLNELHNKDESEDTEPDE